MEETELDKKSRLYWEAFHWFEEYDNQVKQYERCKRLGVKYEPSTKMNGINFPELDAIAIEKAQQIRDLKDFAYVDHDMEICSFASVDCGGL